MQTPCTLIVRESYIVIVLIDPRTHMVSCERLKSAFNERQRLWENPALSSVISQTFMDFLAENVELNVLGSRSKRWMLLALMCTYALLDFLVQYSLPSKFIQSILHVTDSQLRFIEVIFTQIMIILTRPISESVQPWFKSSPISNAQQQKSILSFHLVLCFKGYEEKGNHRQQIWTTFSTCYPFSQTKTRSIPWYLRTFFPYWVLDGTQCPLLC